MSASSRSFVSRRGTRPSAYAPVHAHARTASAGNESLVGRVLDGTVPNSAVGTHKFLQSHYQGLLQCHRLAERPRRTLLIPLERFTDQAREALARVQQLLLRL